MTRSVKSPRQYVKHDYLPHAASPRSAKRAGHGRFNWGSARDYITDGVLEVQAEKHDEFLKEKEQRRIARRDSITQELEARMSESDGSSDSASVMDDGRSRSDSVGSDA